MKSIHILGIALISIICSYSNAAGQDTTRKSYNLFKPLPKILLREDMETDRPNVTESPYTIEAGHLQYEADIFNYEKLHTAVSLQRTWFVNQANLKIGLLKNTALQLNFQSYVHHNNHDLASGDIQQSSGFGDITLRIKQNLLGNYRGSFSIALIPYVKFPTNQYSDNKSYEEGLMVPMVLKLPKDWRIGMMLEIDHLKDDDGDALHNEVLHSLVVSHVLFNKLEVFTESYYTYNFKEHNMVNFLDAALEYEIVKDVKVDIGLNYGLQHNARKSYFTGVAFRY